jgi:hypothetical protein
MNFFAVISLPGEVDGLSTHLIVPEARMTAINSFLLLDIPTVHF